MGERMEGYTPSAEGEAKPEIKWTSPKEQVLEVVGKLGSRAVEKSTLEDAVKVAHAFVGVHENELKKLRDSEHAEKFGFHVISADIFRSFERDPQNPEINQLAAGAVLPVQDYYKHHFHRERISYEIADILLFGPSNTRKESGPKITWRERGE